ncbi:MULTISPECIES: PEP-CTERM sorting domain-containing protein [unclassified Microcystis]|nr:PEP-CTERM sorting domain-containing protein [Microcystis sp. 49638_E5]
MMSLKTSLAGAATAIGLTALAYPAQAAQFSFTYNDAANMIVLSGILTGNQNTPGVIDITGFSNLVYNGVPLAFSTSSGGTVDSYFSNPGNQAKASFDGSVMDFVLFDSGMSDYVGFGPGISITGLAFASNVPGVPGDLEGNEVPFNPSNMMWEAALIPEPGAVVGLLGLGLGALASKVIKKG